MVATAASPLAGQTAGGPSSIVEIEIDNATSDNATNINLFFRPIARKLRGRWSIQRVADKNAMALISQWPDPIPGQRLALDLQRGTVAIIEPLHDADQVANRRRIAATGRELAPAREELGAADTDVVTIAYWMRLAVESGVARVVAGELPDIATLGGKPTKSFFSTPKQDSADKLSLAIENLARVADQQTQILAALVDRLGSK